MEEDVKTLTDYLQIIRRRKTIIILLALMLLATSVVVAVVWPPVYESQATILIEQQHIPAELVKSTVTSYADERINLIQQRVMTIDNLTKIINKFDLYATQKKKMTLVELAEAFRLNARLELVNADVISQGRTSKATLAFKLSFSDKNPLLAQKVANELVTLFLNENVKSRTQRAEETTIFLEEESEKFKLEIQKTENQLALYKEKNKDSLPELLPANLSMITRVESELQQLDLAEKMLDERKISFRSQLAATNPNLSGASSGSAERSSLSLPELKLAHTQLLSKYSAVHPDVVRLQRQIDALEKERAGAQPEEGKDVQEAKQELAKLREQYSDSHPSVKAARRKLTELEQKSRAERDRETTATDYTNPAYLQLKSEMEVADLELATIKGRRAALQEKLKTLEINVAQTHQVERGYYELVRDLDNQKAKYNELKAKQLEAKLAQTLEEEQMAEKFSLLEPPLLPEKPIKPNRLKILMLGIIVSIGGGLGTGFLAEVVDGSIRSYRELAAVAGAEPLIVIPYIQNQDEKDKAKRNLIYSGMIALLLLLGVIIALHVFYMPIDILWFKALNRLELL